MSSVDRGPSRARGRASTRARTRAGVHGPVCTGPRARPRTRVGR
ncbi:hypothetical protein KPATCC21470_6487 [Kitasatospora purpeofusca]